MEFALGFMYVCFGLVSLTLGLLFLTLAVSIFAYVELVQKMSTATKANLKAAEIRGEIEALAGKVTGDTAEKVRASLASVGDNVTQLERIREKLKMLLDTKPATAAS